MGQRIGIVDRDLVAGRQAADIDIEAVLQSGRRRAAGGGLVRQRRGHGRRRWRRSGSAPAPDPGRASADRRRSGRSGWHSIWIRSTELPFGETSVRVPTPRLRRIGAPLRGRRHGALRVERDLRGLGADELHARIGEDRNLIVVGLDDVDVHQLRQLIDIGVALVHQRRGRAVALARRGESSG